MERGSGGKTCGATVVGYSRSRKVSFLLQYIIETLVPIIAVVIKDMNYTLSLFEKLFDHFRSLFSSKVISLQFTACWKIVKFIKTHFLSNL